MPETDSETLGDTVERLRAEKFPHLDKALVREILRLHADLTEDSKTLTSKVGAEIRLRVTKEK
ncbi:hypothetical protein LJR016_002265 [Devosia sp. LjRoot16]|uniref:hypothetical protein n=1 Tax=Devosia sp. LjRoot16 TaxID=3342271 RepID=UPI003ECC7FD4